MTIASLAVVLTLVALKLAASIMTGAVSILSSLVDGMSDSGASLMTLNRSAPGRCPFIASAMAR